MTTKPRAKKFRIRRGGSLSGDDGAGQEASPEAQNGRVPPPTSSRHVEDGFGDNPFPGARAADPDRIEAVKAQIEEIKHEGLTGRQLRIARRLAQRYGFAPENDFDAVRMLRDKGVDPFQKESVLELVVPEDGEDVLAGSGTAVARTSDSGLPATGGGIAPPPATYDAASRAREIFQIQRDIARRRKKQLFFLFTRLSAFVFLPTALVGIYFYVFATPLYATKAEFVIQQADSGGGAGLGGLFSGTGFATSQDSITVQSYLQSREAMIRLDGDIGFKDHFAQEHIDFLRRLPPNASNEEAYRLYQKMVKIAYDPTEGIVKLEVIAADPDTSEQYSRALVKYAEEQVDNLTQRLREDQMKGSRESFEEAEAKMFAAQQKVLELQERLGVIDPASETSAVMSQVGSLEAQLQEKKLQLQQLLDNARPNQARVDGVRGDIARLERAIADLRGQLTESGEDAASLARISAEVRLAELDLETRTTLMQQALQQLETARIEANRQVRYLSLGVSPVAPDEPTYPRKFENTAVSLLIFAGIYLMMSLTASILREQVSA